jgi:hypothetical protein
MVAAILRASSSNVLKAKAMPRVPSNRPSRAKATGKAASSRSNRASSAAFPAAAGTVANVKTKLMRMVCGSL